MAFADLPPIEMHDRPSSTDQWTAASLRTMLSPIQLQIGAAYYHDRETARSIAARLKCSLRTVRYVLAAIRRRCDEIQLPAPRRRKSHGSTRHVRNISEDLYRAL